MWSAGVKQQARGDSAQRPLGLQMSSKVQRSHTGFTIVELVIVVIVVGVLAGIVTVAYRGVTADAHETALRADLKAASAELTRKLMQSNTYPETAEGLPKSDETEYAYEKRGSDGFCLSASSSGAPGKVFYITQEDAVQEGECPPPPPTYIQTITKDACPTERTVVADARDNHTYFIQKMADGQCWMLTNLAYAGGTSNGGANTYSDTISTSVLTNGTSDSATTYTEPKYYIHTDANPTIHPATPSTNTAGGGTTAGGERQYGYHYNWCAAMGAQTSTSACANADTPAPDPAISICPAGWRLPTGESTAGEFTALTTAIGATNSAAGSTTLRSTWLAQYAGYWGYGFLTQGGSGYYWSATQGSTTYARSLYFSSSVVLPSNLNPKSNGVSVRCIAV